MLKNLGFKNVHYVDASNLFLNALKGVRDPEEKRRIFSEIHSRILKETVDELEKYGKFK